MPWHAVQDLRAAVSKSSSGQAGRHNLQLPVQESHLRNTRLLNLHRAIYCDVMLRQQLCTLGALSAAYVGVVAKDRSGQAGRDKYQQPVQQSNLHNLQRSFCQGFRKAV